MVFDRCITGSLKSQTKKKRTPGNKIRYHIADFIITANISPKKILSHIETKQKFICQSMSIPKSNNLV